VICAQHECHAAVTVAAVRTAGDDDSSGTSLLTQSLLATGHALLTMHDIL